MWVKGGRVTVWPTDVCQMNITIPRAVPLPWLKVRYVLWVRVTNAASQLESNSTIQCSLLPPCLQPHVQRSDSTTCTSMLFTNTQRLFSSLSVLLLKEAAAGGITWLGNNGNIQLSQLLTPHTTKHTQSHTYWSLISSSSLMCQMKCNVCWELNPATANQHTSS